MFTDSTGALAGFLGSLVLLLLVCCSKHIDNAKLVELASTLVAAGNAPLSYAVTGTNSIS
jgi:hypothetical protein